MVDLPGVARWVAEQSLLFDEGSPFTADVAAGDPRLLVVTGENASGKSLLFRILCGKVAQAGAVPVTLSIRERAGSGGGDMAGFRRVAMFGEESEQSTGATSVTAITAAFEKNLKHPAGCMLGLDEPELGLSHGYAAALGHYIGAQARKVPAACSGVVVVTHSRPVVRGLLAGYRKTPTHVALGGAADLDAWLADPEERTVDELLNLSEVGLARFRWAAAQVRAAR